MKRALFLLSLLVLPAVAAERSMPNPLEASNFSVPAATEGRLSNGLEVRVVENHERPLVWVTLAFRAGAFADPPGKEGLGTASMELMDDAAGPYDGIALSKALKVLGTQLGSSAGSDGSGLSMQSLKRNLDASLGIMSTVLTQPRFTEEDWKVQQVQMIADVQARRNDPASIADRVLLRVIHGDSYQGRLASEASLSSLDTAQLKAWHKEHLSPAQSLLLVGGDTTLAEIQPLLEKHFGAWKNEAKALDFPVAPPAPTQTQIYLVDKPAAAQSVIQLGRYVGKPTDADYRPFVVANNAVGGMFTSRVNLNLREAKGYTYGARSSVGFNLAGSLWTASAPVATDVTVPALQEFLKELGGVSGDGALKVGETENARNYLRNSFPLRFENPDYLLGQLTQIWRYSLPQDWISRYYEEMGKIQAENAQAAWAARMEAAPLNIVVVGDAAVVEAGLAGLGIPMVKLDVDARPIAEK
ncbi:MAG TPA: pitrilysin family protein [Myxococcota bacterium]|nr:pitrilysin family protein [Myxococcota bacterium]